RARADGRAPEGELLMRSLWVLLLLGTAGCLALYQRSDPWPCTTDSDCEGGLVCRQLEGKPFACVGPRDCVGDPDCRNGDTCLEGSGVCAQDRLTCGSVCTDTTTDPLNCGACGNACAGGMTCSAGACACPANLTLCVATCVDTTSDPQNCGAC